MEEERTELAELDTIESEDLQESAGEAAAEEPVAEEAAIVEIAVEETVAEEPVSEEAAAEEPVAEEAAIVEIAAEEPVSEEAVVEEIAAEEAVVEEIAAEETAAEEPVSEEAAAEEPVAEEAAIVEIAAEEPVSEEAAAEEPVSEETAAEEPVAEEPVSEETAAEEDTAEEPALAPEDAARKLFASYLEPPKDEPKQKEAKEGDLPEPDGDSASGYPVDGQVEPVIAGKPISIGDLAPDAKPKAGAGADEEDDDQEPAEGGRNWFVIHSYSGYENKVKKNLEHRIESLGMQHKIFEVVVPTEEEIELKDGQRRTVERRIFPGYILVDMFMDEDSWYVVRNTPGVTGFVGSVRKPTPLRPRDVDKILKRMRAETPRVTVSFVPGQKVRIADGPFEDFVGIVDEIFGDKGKVRILVSFFGRETPVELDFLQVEKL